MRWERVRQQVVGSGEASLGPGKRWGHTCNAVKGGRFLYVFGGYGRDNCQTNQVHVFDTAKQIWSQPVIKGIRPAPRDSHSCTAVGDNLFVFGGTDGMNPLNDLYILDTSSHTWICPSVRGEGPEAREGHSAALVGKRLFIFGGCGKSSDTNDEVYYNDLYILNTETFVWKRAVTTGTPPSARDSHSCSSWKNKIIVIGGEDGHDFYLSDVHVLDTDTLIWKELNTSGQMLTPRAGHSTVEFGRNLFVFGGFTDAQNLYDDLYVLDVDTGIWSKVLTTGEGPSARFSVAGDCLDPHKGGVLVFVGGCNKTLEALDDMYYLYTGLASEYVRGEGNLGNLSLKKQLKLKCQEQNLANSLYDKALFRIDMNGGAYQTSPGLSCGLPGKKTFQARVTETFPLGYTIETYIDGKPLRGILFANKPSSILTTDQSLSRKRAAAGSTGINTAAGSTGINTAAGSTGIMLNGDHDSRSKALKTTRQDSIDNQTLDGVNTKESLSNDKEAAVEPSDINIKASAQDEREAAVNLSDVNVKASLETEAPANTDMGDQLNSAAQPDEDDVKNEPSSAALNLNDDQTNEAMDSGNELPKDIGAGMVESSVTLYQNQDGTMPATGEHDNPPQSAQLRFQNWP